MVQVMDQALLCHAGSGQYQIQRLSLGNDESSTDSEVQRCVTVSAYLETKRYLEEKVVIHTLSLFYTSNKINALRCINFFGRNSFFIAENLYNVCIDFVEMRYKRIVESREIQWMVV